MAETLEQAYLAGAAYEFRRLKKLADDALAQISEAEFFHRTDASSNSVALIVKHVAGNLRSRWTDFRTADGEKPDRRRDQEFEIAAGDTREALLHRWEEGWLQVFETMDSLAPADLEKTVLIRSEPHSVLEAIQRQLTHNAYHAGQIVFLAKHLRAGEWKTLSIPQGKTEEFNARMQERFRAAKQRFSE